MDSIAGNIELSQQMLDAIKRVIDDHFFPARQCTNAFNTVLLPCKT